MDGEFYISNAESRSGHTHLRFFRAHVKRYVGEGCFSMRAQDDSHLWFPTDHNGRYLEDCQVVDEDRLYIHAANTRDVGKLWELSEKLTGHKFPY